MMKLLIKRFLLFTVLLAAVAAVTGCSDAEPEYRPAVDPDDASTELARQIKTLDGVVQTRQLPKGRFAEKLEVMLSQPLDGRSPSDGVFSQRVIVMHVGYDRPTLLVTLGYGAEGGLSSNYEEELATLFDMNVVMVEHRYFGKSIPEPFDWKYLTAENSAYDLHRVRTLIGQIYPGKWVSTGMSKGGTTTLIYAAYFPNDVDAYVPYVAPMCNAVEDSRFKAFFEEVVPASDQAQVEAFQIELFRRKKSLLPMLEELSASKGYTYRVPLSEIYDYWVFEYAFSFWQVGTGDVKTIPPLTSSDSQIFNAWVRMVDPIYFVGTDNEYLPSFVQNVRELGYYSYDLEPFREYTSLTTTGGYLRRLMLPDELQNEPFSTALYEKVIAYLQQNDPRMVLVYGEYDPWSAAGVAWCATPDKRNMKAYVVPRGNHSVGIGTLLPGKRIEATEKLREWLEN